jgi:hypothetical protein
LFALVFAVIFRFFVFFLVRFFPKLKAAEMRIAASGTPVQTNHVEGCGSTDSSASS